MTAQGWVYLLMTGGIWSLLVVCLFSHRVIGVDSGTDAVKRISFAAKALLKKQ